MVKRDTPYRQGARTPEWEKLKPQLTTEAKIVGLIAGKGAGNGHLTGSFEIELLETGVVTKTATMNDEQRNAHLDPDAWIGYMIEVDHHGWTRKAGRRHKIKHPVKHGAGATETRWQRDPVLCHGVTRRGYCWCWISKAPHASPMAKRRAEVDAEKAARRFNRNERRYPA